MKKIDKIILHCTATKEGRHYAVGDIERWHKQLGYRTIGYHYVIYLDGTVHTGRKENETGAHTAGYNECSIGVCYVGGLDAQGKSKDTRTEVQKKALWDIVQTLQQKYPGATVHGHREFAKKDCPCFDVKKEFSR